MLPQSIHKILEERYGDRLDEFLLPPPVYEFLGSEFVSFDQEKGELVVRFPVRSEWQNPYHIIQGGMLAAAIDNTLGPLSMLLAPPNVTRRMEVKYSTSATVDMKYITVTGRLLGQDGQQLRLWAEVRGPKGELLARARATHWIFEEL